MQKKKESNNELMKQTHLKTPSICHLNSSILINSCVKEEIYKEITEY